MKETNKTKNNKVEYYFTGIAVLVAIILFCVRIYQLNDIKNNRVIVVAYVESTSKKKSATCFNCAYYYNGKIYKYDFSEVGGPWDKGDLVFFEISSKNPQHVKALVDSLVPPCITFKKMPPEGWKEIPTCP